MRSSRGVRPNFGVDDVQEQRSSRSLLLDHPLSGQYRLSFDPTPMNIVMYMLARQNRNYGRQINQDLRILLRNCKLLLKDYPAEEVARYARLAAQLSPYPYSFKYVRKLLEETWGSPPEESSQNLNPLISLL